jgi:hypothetical protein
MVKIDLVTPSRGYTQLPSTSARALSLRWWLIAILSRQRPRAQMSAMLKSARIDSGKMQASSPSVQTLLREDPERTSVRSQILLQENDRDCHRTDAEALNAHTATGAATQKV